MTEVLAYCKINVKADNKKPTPFQYNSSGSGRIKITKGDFIINRDQEVNVDNTLRSSTDNLVGQFALPVDFEISFDFNLQSLSSTIGNIMHMTPDGSDTDTWNKIITNFAVFTSANENTISVVPKKMYPSNSTME